MTEKIKAAIDTKITPDKWNTQCEVCNVSKVKTEI